MRFALVALTLLGCWSDAKPTVESTTPSTVVEEPAIAPRREEPRDPTRMHPSTPPPARIPTSSVWEGQYECTQGWTAVTITLTVDGDDGDAVFEFGSLPGMQNAKTGATRLKGPVTENADGGFSVDLRPFEWVTQPPGYIMVGMTGTTDGPQRKMTGRMTSANCGEIIVERK